MDKFSVTTPLMGEYLTTVRLTTGGLCALVGFDVDTAEDFKVCVTESRRRLRRNGWRAGGKSGRGGAPRAALGLACEIVGAETGGEKEESLEDEISRALLSALLGNVEFVTGADGAVEKIVFEG